MGDQPLVTKLVKPAAKNINCRSRLADLGSIIATAALTPGAAADQGRVAVPVWHLLPHLEEVGRELMLLGCLPKKRLVLVTLHGSNRDILSNRSARTRTPLSEDSAAPEGVVFMP